MRFAPSDPTRRHGSVQCACLTLFHAAQTGTETCMDDLLSSVNGNKTEITPAVSTSLLSLLGSEFENIGGNKIPFKPSVKYLEVHLDHTMSLQQHISSICRSTLLELRKIASILSDLSRKSSASLVSSITTSRLDYCNSILEGLPAKQIARLLKVQNCAAKLVMRG